jgi:hypothetical protein
MAPLDTVLDLLEAIGRTQSRRHLQIPTPELGLEMVEHRNEINV